MTAIEIEQCNNIEALRALCLNQRKQLAVIGEILVEESKWHYTANEAVKEIRDYLTKHQYDLSL